MRRGELGRVIDEWNPPSWGDDDWPPDDVFEWFGVVLERAAPAVGGETETTDGE
jgi:hypothetical protein